VPLGLVICGLAAGLGIAAILAASAVVFTVLKWLGAAYPVLLVIRMAWQAWWSPNVEPKPAGDERRSAQSDPARLATVEPVHCTVSSVHRPTA
jgi:threonine/homoserine/homoserine lactone efflux protein